MFHADLADCSRAHVLIEIQLKNEHISYRSGIWLQSPFSNWNSIISIIQLLKTKIESVKMALISIIRYSSKKIIWRNSKSPKDIFTAPWKFRQLPELLAHSRVSIESPFLMIGGAWAANDVFQASQLDEFVEVTATHFFVVFLYSQNWAEGPQNHYKGKKSNLKNGTDRGSVLPTR